jgi:RND superfamily putative drug exporter
MRFVLTRWGVFVARRRLGVLAVCLAAVAAAAAYGIGVFGSLSNGGYFVEGSESWSAGTTLRDDFPDQPVDVFVIYRSEDLRVTDQSFEGEVTARLDTVTGAHPDLVVRSFYDTAAPSLVSEDQHATQVLLTFPAIGDEQGLTLFRQIDDDLHSDLLSTDVGGPLALFDDVNGQVKQDIARAEAIALPLVLLLSLLIFGSFAAAAMPTLVGSVAVVGAFAVVRAIAGVTEVSVFSINVITLLGMGLAIDYALFVVSRFREELGAGDGTEAALGRTMGTAGRTVFFSGIIVAASLSSLLLFPLSYLRSLGYGGMAAVLVAMVASLTVLPAVLAVLGPRIEWGRVRRRTAGRRGRHASGRQRWAAIAHSVMRRPVLYAVSISAALLLLGTPLLHADFGGVDEQVLPRSSPSRAAALVQQDLFGGERSSADLLITGGTQAERASYAAALGQVDLAAGDLTVAPLAESGDVALWQAWWPGQSQSQVSQDAVRALRGTPVPAGISVQVGGATATTVDIVTAVARGLPWMALLVVTVMMVLLFVAFGSLVLPVKAILMNAVSLGASFGALTWIFQDGHLAGLLNFEPAGYLDATQPILMLAVLFGLSMDYEVFLLSRIREEWDATHDNTAAVAAGLQHTGRIITSAALLLSVVIAGFATSDIVMIKFVGVGMLVAVLLDATVVRALLVPATMRLLGRANWWAPGPLRRWWERHGIREHQGVTH